MVYFESDTLLKFVPDLNSGSNQARWAKNKPIKNNNKTTPIMLAVPSHLLDWLFRRNSCSVWNYDLLLSISAVQYTFNHQVAIEYQWFLQSGQTHVAWCSCQVQVL